MKVESNNPLLVDVANLHAGDFFIEGTDFYMVIGNEPKSFPYDMKVYSFTGERFECSIKNMMEDFNTFGKYDPHNHVLEHSNSYRDVLYDMYIKKFIGGLK